MPLPGWIRNILFAWWTVTFNWDPWQHKELWSCSRGSSWRAYVWSTVVWPRWQMWLGDFSSWCWIYLWSGKIIALISTLYMTEFFVEALEIYYCFNFNFNSNLHFFRIYLNNSITQTALNWLLELTSLLWMDLTGLM